MKPNAALLAKQIERTTLARIKRQADVWYASPAGQQARALSEEFAAKWAGQLATLEAELQF